MNSNHSDLNASEVKYIELSDTELEIIVGGKDKLKCDPPPTPNPNPGPIGPPPNCRPE